MPCFDIIFRPSVEKDLRRLPREVVARVMQRIEQLGDDSIGHAAVKLSGSRGLIPAAVNCTNAIDTNIWIYCHSRTVQESGVDTRGCDGRISPQHSTLIPSQQARTMLWTAEAVPDC